MKSQLTLLGLLVGVGAFAQGNVPLSDGTPLFPQRPASGAGTTRPVVRNNVVTTSTNSAVFVSGGPAIANLPGNPPGFTNRVPGFNPGATVPGVPPQIPVTPPGLPGNTPGLPGNIPGLPGNTPGLPGNTPGLPGNTPGLPGNTPGLPGTTPSLPGTSPAVPQTPSGLPGNVPGLPGGAPSAGTFSTSGTVVTPKVAPSTVTPVVPSRPATPAKR